MLINYYVQYMIIACVLTVVIEVGISCFFKYRKVDLLYIALVQIITNPVLNATSLLIFLECGKKVQSIYIYIMEVLIVLIEGFIYSKCLEKKKINPYLLSLILNTSSYVIGLLIW